MMSTAKRACLSVALGGALASLGGCAAAVRGMGGETVVVNVWVCPSEGMREFEKGKGIYPLFWPTAAIVCRYGPRKGQAQYAGPLLDATLFLVAGKDFDSKRPLRGLARSARFASPCRTSELRGHWLWLSPDQASPVFILVYASAGTGGIRIDAFARSAAYTDPSDPTAFQDHYFRRVLTTQSRIPPYYGDPDGDGQVEIFVAAEVTNMSGAPGTPNIYRVLRWEDHGLRETGQIQESTLLQKVTKLTPL